jgi:predicted nucleotidyltransferase
VHAISLELVDRLPLGLQELYKKVDAAAKAAGCEYLVVGAFARDMVLVHGFGAQLERGTRDVDFGINVSSWEAFTDLKVQLLAIGFTEDDRAIQRLYYQSSDRLPWEIDIVPFGAIENAESIISWPPQHDIAMSVLGFREAFSNAFSVAIGKNPEVTILVASPAGMCLLKLIAWLDRPVEKRRKDAVDILYLITTYPRIPQVLDSLYDDGYMEAQDWHEPKAGAMKLGNDVQALAFPETMSFLERRLLSHARNIERLAAEMSTRGSSQGEENLMLLEILLNSIRPD